jgi:hypothetical protein
MFSIHDTLKKDIIIEYIISLVKGTKYLVLSKIDMQKNEKIKVKLKLDLQEFIDNNPLTYKEISGKKTLLNTLQKIGLMSARVDKSSMSDSESLEKGERFNALALELINSGMRIDKALLRASREVGFGDFKNIKELKARLNEKNEDHFILTLAESIRSGKKEEV